MSASAVLSALGVAGIVAGAVVAQSAPPARTVTVDVQGPQGPQGPPGPPGPPGEAGLACVDGYSPAIVVFPQQGKGPTRIYTCVED